MSDVKDKNSMLVADWDASSLRVFIGIDPGAFTHGVVAWGNRPGCDISGKLLCAKSDATEGEVISLIREIKLAHSEQTPVVGIETPAACYRPQAMTEVLRTGIYAGKFAGHSEARNMHCACLPAVTIRGALCHDAGASDATVKARLKHLYRQPARSTKGNPGPLAGVRDHAWDALAVVTFLVLGL